MHQDLPQSCVALTVSLGAFLFCLYLINRGKNSCRIISATICLILTWTGRIVAEILVIVCVPVPYFVT